VKKLLLIIFVPIGLVLAIPLTLLLLMYDGSSWEDFDKTIYSEDADAMSAFYEDLDVALNDYQENSAREDDLVIPVHEDVINTAIFTLLQGQNDQYLPLESCESSDCLYVIEDEINDNLVYRIKGAWITLGDSSEGQFTFNLALEAGRPDGFTFKTNLQARFTLEDREDEYYLEFDRVRIGSLPLTRGLFTRILSVANVETNLDEEDFPGVDLAIDNLSLTINKAEMLENLDGNDDAMMDLFAEMLNIVFERRLVHFEIQNRLIHITMGISQIRSDDDEDIPPYLYDMHDEQGYNPDLFDSGRFMKTRFDQYTFNRALTGDTRYEIKERHFNKMLYDNFDGFEGFRIDREVNGRMMSVGLQGLWFDFGETDIKIYGLIEIDSIKSVVDMRWDVVELEADRIEYQLSRVAIGDAEGKTADEFILIDEATNSERLEKFRDAFASIGDVEFAIFTEVGNLVISTETLENFMEGGTVEDNITIDSFEINNDGILLDLKASNENLDLILSAFSNSLQDAFSSPTILGNLDDNLNPEPGSPEEAVLESVASIQTALNDNGDVDPELVEELFDAYEQMSPENQDSFMDSFYGEMDENVVDEFGDFFQN